MSDLADQNLEDQQPLNNSLTSMDWLQKLNADYVSKVESAEEEPDSSTCENIPR